MDDAIEYEMDVFLAPDLAPHMNLVQYPTHHHDLGHPLAARIKPRHGILETDHATMDGSIRTYTSQTIPINTHLCLGQVVPGGTSVRLVDSVHLIPISRIVQMRPSFKHLETNALDADAYAPEATNRPVTFQRKESERAAAARKSSYQYKKRSENEEDWCDLQVLHEHSSSQLPAAASVDLPEAVVSSNNAIRRDTYAQKSYCLDLENNLFEPATNRGYIQSLNYLAKGDGETALNDALEEARANPKQALLHKLKCVLQSGVAVPFSAILRKICMDDNGDGIDDELILQMLQETAVLCRGNWCLHSKSCIHLTDRLKRLRTLALLILEEDGIVHRDCLLSAFEDLDDPFLPDQIQSVLNMVGRLDSGGWKPKIEDDNEFIVNHREVCKLQRGYWQRQQERFAEELEAYWKHVSSR